MSSNDMFGEVFDKVFNTREREKMLRELNTAFEKATAEVYGESNSVSLDDIFEEWTQQRDKKVMRVERVKKIGSKKLFYRILTEREDGSMVLESDFPILEVDGHEVVSWQMVNKLQQLAYIGYVLMQSKEYTVEEVN